jgi:hypothetical protein
MTEPYIALLTVHEHESPEYKPRTKHNAGTADLTVALAEDFSSPGEKLTKRCAEGRYVDIPMTMDQLAAARKLFSAWRHFDGQLLNVAGNSIVTLSEHGWDQGTANRYVYDVMAKVHEHRRIGVVQSGGQTGIDIAGAVAAVLLGIPTVMTLPKGFRQRHLAGEARNQTKEQIVEQVMKGVANLTAELNDAPARNFAP